ncbi:MAG TPA: 5'-3' exonuclease H3TH domain-containing protein [Acidimicrobiales bacterium]|nr:5'-3' exonuclease H3TH domain-containing protein [Acidimicrobiales bacterium]
MAATPPPDPGGVRVHLIDGTYELFRHHFGQLAARRGADAGAPAPVPSPRAATRGVLSSLIGMLEDGATHLGVASDHVIESFRNQLWAGYKTGAGVPEELSAQFPLLERAVEALGVKVWAMVELEADDALASASAVAAEDPSVAQVLICTPDKDLGQCVSGTRVVQLDRRSAAVVDEDALRAKYGIGPESIADWLALVGDSADGFPGIPGWGAKSASAVLGVYAHLEEIPDDGARWDQALAGLRGRAKLAANLSATRPAAELFKRLATLVVDRSLLASVGDLAWRAPTADFAAVCAEVGAEALVPRAQRLAESRA